MYDSKTLPLSRRKIIKKSLEMFFGRFLALCVVVIISGPAFIVLSTQQDFLSHLFTYVMMSVGLILVVILGIVFYQYLYYKTYFYQFDASQGQIMKGVVSRATGYVRYERLQNIYIDQDILDRFFGLYDVHYETAGEKSGFYSHVDGLNKENGLKLVEFLNDKARSHDQPVYQDSTLPPTENVPPITPQDNTSISSETISISRKVFPALMVNLVIVWLVLAGLSLALSFHPGFIWATIFVTMFFIYCYIWYKNFRFAFHPDKGEILVKVIGQRLSYLYYDRIQNITLSQGWIDRLFGLYNISVETAGEMSGFSLRLVGYSATDATQIQSFLLKKAKYYKGRLG